MGRPVSTISAGKVYGRSSHFSRQLIADLLRKTVGTKHPGEFGKEALKLFHGCE